MSNEVARKGLRWKIGSCILYVGIFIVLLGVIDSVVTVEGVKRAGGVPNFAGVSRWMDSPRLVAFGFSVPVGCALLMLASALRNSNIPSRLAGLPLVALVATFILGVWAWFPKITVFFGLGGTINVLAICTTLYFCTTGIKGSDPLVGVTRGLGYLFFCYTAWFTCGLLGAPGAGTLYPEFQRDYGVIADLGNKIQVAWVTSWTLTALSFILERRAMAKESRARDASGVAGSWPEGAPAFSRSGAAEAAGAE